MPKAKEEKPVLSRQSLKAAVWYTVTKIIEEGELSTGTVTSDAFAAALTEAVFAQAVTLGMDLEAFAKHAGRMTIGIEDVKLATRNNPVLHEQITLEAIKHGLPPNALKSKSKKEKEKAAAEESDEDDEDEVEVKVKPKAKRKVATEKK